ncbi:MAG: magnesium transporter [Candidatus Paceibacteria bacterium]
MSDTGQEQRNREQGPATPRELILAALEGTHSDLEQTLEGLHEVDIAEAMLDLTDRETWMAFEALSLEMRAEVLAEAEDSLREQLLEQLTPRQIAAIVEEMAADDVVDMLAITGREVTERVLRNVDFERARGLRELASYDPESAGGLMTTEFVVIPENTRIGDAIKHLKQEASEADESAGVFVVDADNRPVGYAPDRELLRHSIHEEIELAMTDPIIVPVGMDQEEVALRIQKYGLNEIAVVDAIGAIVGIVHADDAQDVLEDEASEDMLKLVGTSAEHQTRLPIMKRVRGRIPLQALTVLGGLVTAWIIERAVGGESPEASLLRFIPIIIGLAGNVGIQASTILVRAFATGEVEPDREGSVLVSETIVGMVIGLLCGALTTGILYWTGAEDGRFAIAIGTAITCAVTWAAFLGCGVPMTCRRIGIDPAVVAGPFLITVSDISGTALYLAVAGMLVGV